MKTKVGHQSGFTLIELLVVIAILGILSTSVGGFYVNTSHGDGEKIGQIVKLSKQGLINQTWEGQLIRGGMNGGSGAFGTVPFNFTVESDDLVAKVKQYMQNQTEVLVAYRIEGIYSPFRSESRGHFLTNIEPAQK